MMDHTQTERLLIIVATTGAALVVAVAGFFVAMALANEDGNARPVKLTNSVTIVGSAGERLGVGSAVVKIPESREPITGAGLRVSDLLLVAGINVPTMSQGRSLVLAAVSSSPWALIDADTGDELGVVPASPAVEAVAVSVDSPHQRFEIVVGGERSGPLQVSIACASVAFTEPTPTAGASAARYVEADVRDVPPLASSC